jgi:hypothetical protein
MRNYILQIFLIFPFLGMSQNLENLDSKYGLNKFKLEEPFLKYKNQLSYDPELIDQRGVEKYLYTGKDLGFAFRIPISEIHLDFYKDKLCSIELILSKYISDFELQNIKKELTSLFGESNSNYKENDFMNFNFGWLTEKTGLYLMESHNKDKTNSTVSISIFSRKILKQSQADQF